MRLLHVELHPGEPYCRTVPVVEGTRNRVSEDRAARAAGRQRRSTTGSSCSTRRAGSRAGTAAPSASRVIRADEIIGRHFSTFYPKEAVDQGPGRRRSSRLARTRRPLRGRRLAHPQGRDAVLGQRRDQRGAGRTPASCPRLRQGDAATSRAASSRSISCGPQPPSCGPRTPTSRSSGCLVDERARLRDLHARSNGCILTWNEGAERIKGYREREVLGGHFSIFYTQEDLDRGHPPPSSRKPRRSGATRKRAGESARTAPGSGRTS